MLVEQVSTLHNEIRSLKEEKNAVILAHNYQVPNVQDVADFVGDSLGLARKAAETDSDIIVFCGVHFMAETASIISPDKTVLIPSLEAGCSLSDTITAKDLREWKRRHPDAVSVGYVNTTADVKAELDYCCTSSNAVSFEFFHGTNDTIGRRRLFVFRNMANLRDLLSYRQKASGDFSGQDHCSDPKTELWPV